MLVASITTVRNVKLKKLQHIATSEINEGTKTECLREDSEQERGPQRKPLRRRRYTWIYT